jgi:hypothetical protein
MTELITAWAAVATALVIGTSAVAALVQLRHMRASNQLEAILALERDFRSEEIQAALLYVQTDLPEKLKEQTYREGLARRGFIDPQKHPEVVACNWFTTMGTLLKYDLVSNATFMDLFARLITYYWESLSPAIAIMRRSRGEMQYHDFEYLAEEARQWIAKYPAGAFPRKIRRAPLTDAWIDHDTVI